MSEFNILVITVLSISSLHTFSGPDHYLPFIVLSRSKKWSVRKTVLVTSMCGLAHVFSSVLIGFITIALGWTFSKTLHLEFVRGQIASWMLLFFGIIYIAYSLYKLTKNKTHKHFEISDQNDIYVFEHQHKQTVIPNKKHKVTPWILFFIFATGPSEPIIPLLVFPSLNFSIFKVWTLILFYAISTVLTMLILVFLGITGSNLVNYKSFEKYTDLISGVMIVFCAIGMLFLNW